MIRPATAFALVATLLGPSLFGQELDPERVKWTKLTFRAKKLGLSTTADISLRVSSPSEAAKELIAVGDATGLEPSGDIYVLDVGNQFMGRKSVNSIWFDPANGQTFQRLVTETGKRNRYKVSRYAADGVSTLRKVPRKGEEDKGVKGWTDQSETFESHPPGFSVVIEPGTLFYLVSASNLSKTGQSMEAVFHSRDGLAVAEITVEGRTEVRVDYEEVGRGPVDGRVPAIKLAVRAKPMEGTSGQIELIGLQGDVEIFLHPLTRVPLLVSGKVQIAGKVNIKLKRVEMR